MKSASHVYHDIFQAAASGWSLVTANSRLANHLHVHYAQLQQAAGLRAWPGINIAAVGHWLNQLWQQCQDHALLPPKQLLSVQQTRLLWEQVISAHPASTSIFDINATATQAIKAWQLAVQWQLPLDSPLFAQQTQTKIWQQWAMQFAEQCQLHAYITAAELAPTLAECASEHRLPLPPGLILLGLDEVPHALRNLLTLIAAQDCQIRYLTPQHSPGRHQLIAANDTAAELWQMAQWAKQQLQQSPDTNIACIVPNLADIRDQVEHVLQQVFSPELFVGCQQDYAPSYNISAGKPLASFAVTGCAQWILALTHKQITLRTLGALLRSSFLAGSDKEATTRANLDFVLHEYGHTQISLAVLIKLLTKSKACGLHIACPILAKHLQQFASLCAELPKRAYASQWATLFAKLFASLGWPGDRSLDSHEYQVVQRLHELQQEFLQLDHVSSPMSLAQAIKTWQHLTLTTVFQFKSANPRVHVLGSLEAVGLSFDAAWIMGLHDGLWPAAITPNPFLPISLQRTLAMPQSSAERELLFTQQLTAHLLQLAPNIIVSYPIHDGDNPLRASQLISHLSRVDQSIMEPNNPSIAQILFAHAAREPILNDVAPALRFDEKIRGGSQLFKLQAACPFQAFATLRLHAKSLKLPHLGLDALARGQLVHRSLELLWQQLHTQQALLALTEQQLHHVLSTIIDTALAELSAEHLVRLSPVAMQLEKTRLQIIIQQWLAIEKQRAPFSVLATEQRKTITLGNVTVNVVLDRLDKIADQHIIIDYKTGDPSILAWFSTRPDEPQLPLYCISSELPIGGLFFAQIQTNKLQFKGIIENTGLVPNSKAPQDFATRYGTPYSWQTMQQDWRMVLTDLAQHFCGGHAEVSPKQGQLTCQYCKLTSLCRIHELHDG